MFARIGQLGTLGCECILIALRDGMEGRYGLVAQGQAKAAEAQSPPQRHQGRWRIGRAAHAPVWVCWASTYTHMQQSAGLAAAARSARSRGGRQLLRSRCASVVGRLLEAGSSQADARDFSQQSCHARRQQLGAAPGEGGGEQGGGRVRMSSCHCPQALPALISSASLVVVKRQVKHAAHASPRNS